MKIAEHNPTSILPVQKKSETPFFDHRSEHGQPFFAPQNITPKMIHRQIEDDIHAPLLDSFSHDTGRPRDTVSQHDPAYAYWLKGESFYLTNIKLNMPVPAADPKPDYSHNQTQLGAWEKANFIAPIRAYSICDNEINNGIESSFVTHINFEFTQSKFEYFIDSQIDEKINDESLELQVRNIWRQVNSRIRHHAKEHFERYRQVVTAKEQGFRAIFSSLPNRLKPIQIPKQDLQIYVDALLSHLIGQLEYDLWDTTCNWEHTDYPTLFKGINIYVGNLKPTCGSKPIVPPKPTLPIVVKVKSKKAQSRSKKP